MRRVNDKPVKIGEKRTRYTFRLYDEPETEKGSQEARRRLMGLLQDLIDQPALLNAGPTRVESFSVSHDGTCWVLYGEAEADDA